MTASALFGRPASARSRVTTKRCSSRTSSPPNVRWWSRSVSRGSTPRVAGGGCRREHRRLTARHPRGDRRVDPTTKGAGTNQDEVFVIRADQLYLWESPPKLRLLEQTKAEKLEVLAQIWGYY